MDTHCSPCCLVVIEHSHEPRPDERRRQEDRAEHLHFIDSENCERRKMFHFIIAIDLWNLQWSRDSIVKNYQYFCSRCHPHRWIPIWFREGKCRVQLWSKERRWLGELQNIDVRYVSSQDHEDSASLVFNNDLKSVQSLKLTSGSDVLSVGGRWCRSSGWWRIVHFGAQTERDRNEVDLTETRMAEEIGIIDIPDS